MYRYHRPLEFHGITHKKLSSRSGEIRTALYGGICFRLHTTEEHLKRNEQYVTFSLCHSKELFNKDVARRIADARAEHEAGYWIHAEARTPSEIMSALSVLSLSSSVNEQNLQNHESSLSLYKSVDLSLLHARYDEIENINIRAHTEQKMEFEILNAMNLKAKYASKNR
jgi:hypothetical protein